ncbi:bucentaur or craniofacial development-domain-containing protein [Bombardia bombarda]|uniref:SWR1-complex protein 5 n=1 Tax=Bombardia bombarda TaxID=252184 RepID=A0AA40C1M5_9PEZI|nr:bucentaur or craniofacial development-domain-containing protein [Bombardia bombarda]
MPPDPTLDIEDDDYASSEDSDFAPDDVVDEASASEEEGGDDDTDKKSVAAAPAGKRKRPVTEAGTGGGGDDADDDVGFVNSGDEAIIEKGKKRRKKTKTKDGAKADNGDDEGEGGEGGLIKTRSMRAVEKAKRHTIVATSIGPVTVDVDALWAQMISEPIATTKTESADTTKPASTTPSSQQSDTTAAPPQGDDPPELIRIKRTYNFAGKVHSEEKLVARDSAEARLYLASLQETDTGNSNDTAATAKRMPKKAFRSAFEPITEHMLSRADLNLGVSVRLRARALADEANAKKLNTVEKSRMDWAGYVDKEGIKDELALAGKSKDSFAARQDFLARSEARREEDARRVRLATAAAGAATTAGRV